MKRLLAILVLLAALIPSTVVLADSPLPPPPPPPPCSSCVSPPLPPTPVASLQPKLVAPQPLVEVHLDTAKVARGHRAKMTIKASTGDTVALRVQYRKWKPHTSHSKVGKSGNDTQTWKIPKHAPLGKAEVTVTVVDGGDSLSKTLSIQVTK
ncbi:MAG: hypothetical protein ACRDFX_04150 [Chloroflexota bacterium]